MTTKVVVSCPDNSHWPVKVTIEDQVYDHDKKVMTSGWKPTGPAVVLKPTESHSTYITNSRRLIIEEGDPIS